MECMLNKMFIDHQKKMQLFVKEEFLAYEKAFTRNSSGCSGCNARSNIIAIDDMLDKSLISKFMLPLNSTKELVEWNTEIKNEAYLKFMVSFHKCNFYILIFPPVNVFRKTTSVRLLAWIAKIQKQKMLLSIAFRVYCQLT